MRAGLTSGEILLSVVPAQAAANLYNRGFPIRLANTMTDGLLYTISSASDVNGIADLAGHSLAVPFRGDTPEIILGRLLTHHGLNGETDLAITYAGSPIEAIQLLIRRPGPFLGHCLGDPAACGDRLWAGDNNGHHSRRGGGLFAGYVAYYNTADHDPGRRLAGGLHGCCARHRDPGSESGMTQAFGAEPLRRFLTVGIRQTTTTLFPALALGTAFKVAVMAELLVNAGGIGGALADARVNIDIAQALAWVVIAVTLLLVVKYTLVQPVKGEIDRWCYAAQPWGVKR